MLPGELLQNTLRGGEAFPFVLKGARTQWAASVLEVICAHMRRTRGELQHALASLEGDSPDYRLVRGLAHLALEKATFEVDAPLDPQTLRRRAFAAAAQRGLHAHAVQKIVEELAAEYNFEPDALREALYADLPENHRLTAFPDMTPEALVDRYNLAQAQGLLYRATHMSVTAHRNVPGEYRRLFRWLKFYGLMYAVEGNLDDGYRIYVDGPASIFRQTQKYGVKMAAFLPSLLHVTRWEMEAEIEVRGRRTRYALTSEAALRSHYPKPPEFDSLIEAAFAERWERLQTPWRLEREVEIVDLKGTVFVPDFGLRHAEDGRYAHMEIIGFWHPDYLRRKFDKVRRAGLENLILAVSDRLNVSDEHLAGVNSPIVHFKGKLEPKALLSVLETL
jgi:uncharacterized protein